MCSLYTPGRLKFLGVIRDTAIKTHNTCTTQLVSSKILNAFSKTIIKIASRKIVQRNFVIY